MVAYFKERKANKKYLQQKYNLCKQLFKDPNNLPFL